MLGSTWLLGGFGHVPAGSLQAVLVPYPSRQGENQVAMAIGAYRVEGAGVRSPLCAVPAGRWRDGQVCNQITGLPPPLVAFAPLALTC